MGSWRGGEVTIVIAHPTVGPDGLEARPSKLGGEDPVCKKLQPTMGGKTPWKEFLQAGKVKKPRRYWPGTVALPNDLAVPKEHRAPYLETLLLVASPQDSPRSGQI